MTTDWVALAKGNHRLWPDPDEQTVRGHLDVSHGGYDDAPNPSDTAELLTWHKGVHDNHGDEIMHKHLSQFDPERILEDAKTRIRPWQWFYTSRGEDGLRPEQVQAVFDGLPEFELEDQIMDNADWWSYRDKLTDEQVAEVVGDDTLLEALRDSDEHYQALREAVQDADESTVINDLAEASGDMLMRYRLGDDPGNYTDLQPNSWNMTKGEVTRAARHLAKVAGLPWADPYKEQMRELVVNSGYGGELFIFWYAKVGQILQAVWEVRGGLNEKRTITWTNPTLLLLDYYNGSGHEVRLEGEFTRPFDPDRLSTDEAGPGYGWDKVCGLVKSAYRTDVTIKEVENGQDH